MRLKDNRHGTTKSAEQFSLMTTINEEDRTLGLRIFKISVSKPNSETRTTRHPIDKLASTQIGTEVRTQIDNIIKTDQATPGTTNQTTWQQTQYNFNARPEKSYTQYNRNFPQSNNLPTPNSVQFIDGQGQDVINTPSGFFPLNYWSLRDLMNKVTSNHVFIWMPSKSPPEKTAKKIIDSKSNLCSTLVQPAQ